MSASVAQELQDIRRMPYGTARTAAAEAVTRRIDAEGPREKLPEALLDLVEAYTFDGEGSKSFVVHARLTRLWDESPELFDSGDRRNFFWELGWVASDLADFPQISREQAEAFLADMERRFQLDGHGLSAVRARHFFWAWWAGQPNAEEARLAWAAGFPDDMDFCRACLIGHQTMYLTEAGRYAEAIEMGLSQDDDCNREPACTHQATALAALLSGDPALAHAQYALALSTMTEGNRDNAPARGKGIELLARGGQLERALRTLRNDDIKLLRAGSSPLLRLRFLIHVLAGLSANLTEHAALETGLRDPEWRTVSDLHTWVQREAAELAAQFDARNGTGLYASRVEQALAATLAEKPLPEESAEAVHQAQGAAADPGEAPAAEAHRTADRFETAEQLAANKQYREATSAYREAAETFAAEGWIERAGLANAEAAQCAALAGEDSGAHDLFGASLAQLRAGGADPEAVVAVLTAWAPIAARMGDPACHLRATLDELDGYTELPEEPGLAEDLAERRRSEWLRRRATLRDTLARATASAGADSLPAGVDAARAVSEAQAAGEEFAQLGLISDAAHAFWLAGKIQQDTGDTEGAVWSLESAFEGFTAAHRREERANAASELIELLRATGQTDRANEIIAQL